MILLIAIPAGWLVGWLAATLRRSRWNAPTIRLAWLAIIGFLPQYFAVYASATSSRLSDIWVAIALTFSSLLFLVFCWFNRRVPGIPIMALGLVLNLLVMVANHGFMPISPQVASRLVPYGAMDNWLIGSRFGWKDILLLPEDTFFHFLSDRYLPPRGSPYQVAFSLGDVFIAIGAFWIMAAGGILPKNPETKGS